MGVKLDHFGDADTRAGGIVREIARTTSRFRLPNLKIGKCGPAIVGFVFRAVGVQADFQIAGGGEIESLQRFPFVRFAPLQLDGFSFLGNS